MPGAIDAGLRRRKMSAIGRTLSALNRFAGSEVVERFGLRRPAQAIAYHAVKEGFAVGSAAARQWKAVTALAAPSRLATPPATGKDRFDLNVTEEQQMIRDSAQRVAKEQMRPAAIAADAACAVPDEVMAKLDELCLAQYAIPEALGGAGTERSPVTSAIVAETLGHGDMGMAVAALAPVGVVNALVRWGSADQQAKYLPPFASEAPPRAAVAIVEPQPLFDPMAPKTKARAEGGGYVLSGKKSLVPLAESAELFLVTADLEGKGPRVFIVERGAAGLTHRKRPGHGRARGGHRGVSCSTTCKRRQRRAPRRRSVGASFYEELGGPFAHRLVRAWPWAPRRPCSSTWSSTATTASRSASPSATGKRWRS